MRPVQKILLPAIVFLITSCISFGPGEALVKINGGTDLSSTEIGNALEIHDTIFDVARVSIRKLRFKEFDQCDFENTTPEFVREFGLSGHMVFDLLNHTVKPEIAPVRILTNIILCSVSIGLQPLSETANIPGIDEDDELIGSTALFKGEHNDIPFVVKIDLNETVELQSDINGLDFGKGDTNAMVIFKLSKLFKNINLDVLDQTGGVVYIDTMNNTAAHTTARNNFKTHILLIKDENKNGLLDDDDTTLAD
jgi:hypothetical protein